MNRMGTQPCSALGSWARQFQPLAQPWAVGSGSAPSWISSRASDPRVPAWISSLLGFWSLPCQLPRGRGFCHRVLVAATTQENPVGAPILRAGREENIWITSTQGLAAGWGFQPQSWVSWKFSTSLLGRAEWEGEDPPAPRGLGGAHSPGAGASREGISCLCSPESWVPALIPVLWQGWQPPPLPAGPGSSPGAWMEEKDAVLGDEGPVAHELRCHPARGTPAWHSLGWAGWHPAGAL